MSATQENEKMIFETALELKTDAERTTYLDKVCGFNLTLKARIMALLQARDGGGDYLETLMKDPGFSVKENVLEKKNQSRKPKQQPVIMFVN